MCCCFINLLSAFLDILLRNLAKRVNEMVPIRHYHRSRVTAAGEASKFSLFGRIAIYAFHQEIFPIEGESKTPTRISLL
jgi:hypothetical protein